MVSVSSGVEEQLATAVRYGGRAGAGHYRVYGKFFQRDAANIAPAYSEAGIRLGWRVLPSVEVALIGRDVLRAQHVEFASPTSSPPPHNSPRSSTTSRPPSS